MSVRLYVFAADFDDDPEPEELAQCDFDDYCDFVFFLACVECHLGTDRYPTLMRLSDSDGRLTPTAVRALEREIQEIAAAFRELPAHRMKSAFQRATENRAAAEASRQSCKCSRRCEVDDPLSRITVLEWSAAEIGWIEREVGEIAAVFHELSTDEPAPAAEHATATDAAAGSLYDCFQDANGVNLFDSLFELCVTARGHQRPVSFM
jgi:hypothetical protein